MNMKNGKGDGEATTTDVGTHNNSTDSIGNISQQSTNSSGTSSMSPGHQNLQAYNNLLHNHCLYDAIYQDENCY